MSRLIAVLLLVASWACAQAPPPAVERPQPQRLAALFGPTFKPVDGFAVLTADLDGDGTEDAVVVAIADNPLLDQTQFNYKVIDPFDAYFGFSDPKMTVHFAQEEHPRLLLVVHNWRKPGQKFVIINMPLERINLGRVAVKKKVVPAIVVEELTSTKSFLYWDGKKWRWKESSSD
jgi:hypothetical protein